MEGAEFMNPMTPPLCQESVGMASGLKQAGSELATSQWIVATLDPVHRIAVVLLITSLSHN